MNKKIISLMLILVAVIMGIGIYGAKVKQEVPVPGETSTTTPTVSYIPYGKVVLTIGETVQFKDNSITLLRVVEESRCPAGVTCIWAGTVKAEILSVTRMGTSTEKIELGKFLTTEGEKIEVTSVTPYPTKDIAISQNAYKVTFEVSKRGEVVTNPSQKACHVGGCSSQLCSDTPGVASTCEFREVYSCYQKTSSCKRQSNGECGWTQTNELKVCIANAI